MLAKLINLAVLGLMPLAWLSPLAQNDGGWFFSTTEITVFSGVAQLYQREPALGVIVGLFAVVAPYLKSLLLVYVQFSDAAPARILMPVIEFLARLSMADVFLLAFYIAAYSGVGEMTTRWGLYFFTSLVVASIIASWLTQLRLRRQASRNQGRPSAPQGG
ncbi:MAG: paraquat-inducible protein A [Neomegalonema sp.]|nr:paraquat-inducible protein A [Neomegalonema sp.]